MLRATRMGEYLVSALRLNGLDPGQRGTTTEQTCVLSLHDLSSGCNNVLAHCGLRNAQVSQVPAQGWHL